MKRFGLQFSVSRLRSLANSLARFEMLPKLFAVGHITKPALPANEVTRHRNSHCAAVIPKPMDTPISPMTNSLHYSTSIRPQQKFPFSRALYAAGTKSADS